jgi:hypothetical protein
MSAFDPKRTSKARQSGGQEDYFFTLDLLGGEAVWQALHGLPFAILAVACALDIVSEFIASVRKNMIMVPITVVTIPVFFAGCILPSNLSAPCTPILLKQHELKRIYPAEAATISIGLRANSPVLIKG